jgi:hypothetical protein
MTKLAVNLEVNETLPFSYASSLFAVALAEADGEVPERGWGVGSE